MSAQIRGLRVASAIFAIFTLGHIIRLITQAKVTVGPYTVPLWTSVVAAVIALILSFWFWRLSSVALGE